MADSIYDPFFGQIDLQEQQSVGLVFDNNDFPVISFTTYGPSADGGIWLAYDPPTSDVPEPSSLVLLIGGAIFLLFIAWRRRLCLAGK